MVALFLVAPDGSRIYPKAQRQRIRNWIHLSQMEAAECAAPNLTVLGPSLAGDWTRCPQWMRMFSYCSLLQQSETRCMFHHLPCFRQTSLAATNMHWFV